MPWNGHPKPPLVTFSTLADLLHKAKLFQDINLKNRVRALVFQHPDGARVFIYDKKNDAIKRKLRFGKKLPANCVRVDIMNNHHLITSATSFSVSAEPLIIVAPKTAPETLAAIIRTAEIEEPARKSSVTANHDGYVIPLEHDNQRNIYFPLPRKKHVPIISLFKGHSPQVTFKQKLSVFQKLKGMYFELCGTYGKKCILINKASPLNLTVNKKIRCFYLLGGACGKNKKLSVTFRYFDNTEATEQLKQGLDTGDVKVVVNEQLESWKTVKFPTEPPIQAWVTEVKNPTPIKAVKDIIIKVYGDGEYVLMAASAISTH